MHVISFSRLREFGRRHADAQKALDDWFKVASKASWKDLLDVLNLFFQWQKRLKILQYSTLKEIGIALLSVSIMKNN